MREVHVSHRAEAEIDDIWLYIARESLSIDIANRVVDGITDVFALLARHPEAGRGRNDIGPGIRSFAISNHLIVYELTGNNTLSILHVLARGRDVPSAFRQ